MLQTLCHRKHMKSSRTFSILSKYTMWRMRTQSSLPRELVHPWCRSHTLEAFFGRRWVVPQHCVLLWEPKKGSWYPFGSNCFEYRVCFYLFLSFWSENASMLSLFANTEMSYVCWVPRVHHRVQASLCAWSANRQDCGKICDGYQVPMSYIGKKIERMTGQISEWLVKSVIGPKWLCHRIHIALSFPW